MQIRFMLLKELNSIRKKIRISPTCLKSVALEGEGIPVDLGVRLVVATGILEHEGEV